MEANLERLTQTFLDLVRIPSPSRHERGVADHIRHLLEPLGYQILEDGAGETIEGNCGNLIVIVPATGDGPNLLLSAHMDTVETGQRPVGPTVENHVARSDGSTILGADDKAGVAALLELLQCLAAEPVPHGELRVCFSVAEEKELLGALELDPMMYKDLDAGLVLDHSLPNEIIIGAPTKLALQLTVYGTGGHGAFPDGRINAAHVLTRALSRLPSKRLDEFTTCNLGVVRAGTAINVIPDSAYAEYELRSHSDELLDFHLARTLTSIEAAVREARVFQMTPRPERSTASDAAADAADAVRKATVEVDVITCYECFRHAPESVPVQLAEAAITKAGMAPKTVIAQGGSDANVLNKHGLPSVVLGCGMHGAHNVNETANLRETAQAVAVVLHAIQP